MSLSVGPKGCESPVVLSGVAPRTPTGAANSGVRVRGVSSSPVRAEAGPTGETFWCAVCVLELQESPCWSCGANVHEFNRRAEHPLDGSAQPGMEVGV